MDTEKIRHRLSAVGDLPDHGTSSWHRFQFQIQGAVLYLDYQTDHLRHAYRWC